MVGHYYPLTSSERQEIAAQEMSRLRRLRLLQVRQQAKDHAKNVREAVKNEKDAQQRCLASNLRASWSETRARRAEEEEEETRRSLAEVGAAHREADNLTEALLSSAPSTEKVSTTLLQTATKRGDDALKKMTEERRDAEREEGRKKAYRERALAKEHERAKRIASLPPPATSADVPVKTEKPAVVLTDASLPCPQRQTEITFASCRPEEVEPSTTAIEEAEDVSAALAARAEARSRDMRELLARAQERGRRALNKAVAERESKDILDNLDALQMRDRRRRGAAVHEMAPQIVLPTGQIQSLKEELELAAEHFFEDAWRRNNRYQLEPETELVVDDDLDLDAGDESQDSGSGPMIDPVPPSQPAKDRLEINALLARIVGQRLEWRQSLEGNSGASSTTTTRKMDEKTPPLADATTPLAVPSPEKLSSDAPSREDDSSATIAASPVNGEVAADRAEDPPRIDLLPVGTKDECRSLEQSLVEDEVAKLVESERSSLEDTLEEELRKLQRESNVVGDETVRESEDSEKGAEDDNDGTVAEIRQNATDDCREDAVNDDDEFVDLNVVSGEKVEPCKTFDAEISSFCSSSGVEGEEVPDWLRRVREYQRQLMKKYDENRREFGDVKAKLDAEESELNAKLLRVVNNPVRTDDVSGQREKEAETNGDPSNAIDAPSPRDSASSTGESRRMQPPASGDIEPTKMEKTVRFDPAASDVFAAPVSSTTTTAQRDKKENLESAGYESCFNGKIADEDRSASDFHSRFPPRVEETVPSVGPPPGYDTIGIAQLQRLDAFQNITSKITEMRLEESTEDRAIDLAVDNSKNEPVDISGDLSGYLEDDFWTRRHSELQGRILHIESLKQNLMRQLQQRQATLESIQAEEASRESCGSVFGAVPAFPAAMAPSPPPPMAPPPSSRPVVGFDLSTIIEGDSYAESKLDSFHGLPTMTTTTTKMPSATLPFQDSSLMENWKTLTSETLTSLETGKLSSDDAISAATIPSERPSHSVAPETSISTGVVSVAFPISRTSVRGSMDIHVGAQPVDDTFQRRVADGVNAVSSMSSAENTGRSSTTGESPARSVTEAQLRPESKTSTPIAKNAESNNSSTISGFSSIATPTSDGSHSSRHESAAGADAPKWKHLLSSAFSSPSQRDESSFSFATPGQQQQLQQQQPSSERSMLRSLLKQTLLKHDLQAETATEGTENVAENPVTHSSSSPSGVKMVLRAGDYDSSLSSAEVVSERENTSDAPRVELRASTGRLSHHSHTSATSATSYFELPASLPKEIVLGLAQSTAGHGEWDDETTRRWLQHLKAQLEAHLVPTSSENPISKSPEDHFASTSVDPTAMVPSTTSGKEESITDSVADDVRSEDEQPDHDDDLRARLQTLADETTGITDVSIASFASDVSEASAFRPMQDSVSSSHRASRGLPPPSPPTISIGDWLSPVKLAKKRTPPPVRVKIHRERSATPPPKSVSSPFKISRASKENSNASRELSESLISFENHEASALEATALDASVLDASVLERSTVEAPALDPSALEAPADGSFPDDADYDDLEDTVDNTMAEADVTIDLSSYPLDDDDDDVGEDEVAEVPKDVLAGEQDSSVDRTEAVANLVVVGGEDSGMNSSDMNNNDFDRVDMEVENSISDAAPLDDRLCDADDELALTEAYAFPSQKPTMHDSTHSAMGPTGDYSGALKEPRAAAIADGEAGDGATAAMTSSTTSAAVAFFEIDFDATSSKKALPTTTLAAAFDRSGKAGAIDKREESRKSRLKGKSPSPATTERPDAEPEESSKQKLVTSGSSRSRNPRGRSSIAKSPTPASSTSVTGDASPSSSPRGALAVGEDVAGVTDAKVGRCQIRTAEEGKDVSASTRDYRSFSDAKKREMEMKERTRRLVQRLEEVRKANAERQKKESSERNRKRAKDYQAKVDKLNNFHAAKK